MNLRKCTHIAFSLAASSLLLAGMFLALHASAQTARATPGDLFVIVSGSGTTCTQAAPCSLATALAQAVGGDTIYVAHGTYTGAGEAVVTISDSISVLGGWDGSLASPPVRNPSAYPTTLDGENARRVVIIDGNNITPTLSGFTITHGNASASATAPRYGGGIYSSGANPVITDNDIVSNTASTITTDWAYGGGMYLEDSDDSLDTARISVNLFAYNTAGAAHPGQGGGLAVQNADNLLISDNTFLSNLASTQDNGMGGGLYLYDSAAVIRGNVIMYNHAASESDGFGGGFYSQFGEIALDANTILSNTAEYGAVTFESQTAITLTNNIVAQNTGGGVFVRGNPSSPLVGILANNTIANNGTQGVYAGWFSSGNSTLTLTNNLIVGHATGIYAYEHANPNTITASHTLFYGNTANTAGSSITSAAEITGRDPRFEPSMYYRLLSGSPAVDAGLTLPWLITDVDGDVRPWPASGGYDIGADEVLGRPVYLTMILNRAK